jgi:probable phosphoglycerate mutase
MKVYFVRHAQSSFNALDLLHQYSEGELSEFGIHQAEFVANRFSSIPIDLILSSPFERAKATATIIKAVIQKPIKYTKLLAEFRGPSEIEGLHKEDPEVKRVMQLMHEHRHEADWKYSDEENFVELRGRANKVTKYLEEQRTENILCVTHGLFLRAILAVMMFGADVTLDELLKFMRFVRVNNTGITVCEQLPSGHWRLVTLNDHAHLG